MLHFCLASECIRRVKMVRDIFFAVLQRDGYFGHLENLLLAMISDERQNIASWAYAEFSKHDWKNRPLSASSRFQSRTSM